MIKTEHYDGLNRTPAVKLAARAWYELLLTGMAEEVCIVGWDQHAIVAFDRGEPVGVITFQIARYARQADIMLGYVLREHRARGVYTAMWQRLVTECRQLDLVQITGGTHVENSAMRATARRLGREETGVILRYNIPPVTGKRDLTDDDRAGQAASRDGPLDPSKE